MKLKEKLMRDFVETRRGNQDQYAEMLSECWLNAFEKAREMAKTRVDLGFERNDVIQDILDDIDNLGEEEV